MRQRLIAASLLSLLDGSLVLGQEAVVAGRVLARDGQPVGHAALLLRWRMAPELPGLCGVSLGDAGLAELQASADDRGAFKITVPHRGPFELVAQAGTDRSTPSFPVLAGAFVEVRLAAPVTVAGTVIDAAGAPLASTAVSLVPEVTAWSKLAAYRLPQARAATVTDAAGHFELPFSDAYLRFPRWEPFLVLDVDVPLLAQKKHELLRPTDHCRTLQLLMVDVAQADARSPRAVGRARKPLATSPLPTVRARLLHDGAPLADAPVLWSRLVTVQPPQEVQTRTDAEGNAVLNKGQPDGTVLGFVLHGGCWLPFARVRVVGDDLDLGTVAIANRTLKGMVLDTSGQPVPGARIAVLAQTTIDDELPQITFADHGGRFALEALPAGPLQVWAECGMHGFATAPLPEGTRELTLRTTADGVVAGETIDADGKPFAKAWLLFVRQGTHVSLMPGLREGATFLCVHSDEAGRVRVTGLPAGKWQVIGNAVREGRLHGGRAEVADGGEFTLTLKVHRE